MEKTRKSINKGDPSNPRQLISKAFKANPNTISLRATIPESVAMALKLEHGDQISWTLEIQGDEIIAIVRKFVIKNRDTIDR